MSRMRKFCLEAVSKLDDQDLADLTDAIEAYVRAGMASDQAERAATEDLLAQAKQERSELAGLLREQFPDLFAGNRPPRPKPPAAPAPAMSEADLGAMFDDLLAEEAAPTAPAPAANTPFDSEAWDKARADTIKASREAGNVHLDQLTPAVETMRGKAIYYAHDPKERGVIRTVDNRGNVYVNWSDDYSAQKNLAQPTKDGKRTVYQTSLGPTDLKDYVVGTPAAAPAAPRAPRAPRTATQAAGSAAVNTAKGLDNAIKGLGELFGGKGKLGSGLSFDEQTYERAKPLFAAAVANLKDAAADLREAMRTVIRMVVDQFGREAAENMKPYVVRFIGDVQAGRVEIGAPATDTRNQEQGNGQGNPGAQGAEALGDVAAGQGGGAAGRGPAGRGGAGRGRAGAAGDRRAREPRVSGARGGGSGSTSVRAPAAGAGGGRGRLGTRRTGREGTPVPGAQDGRLTEPVSVPNIPAVNFRITDEVRLGQGGEAEKFRDNIAAIRALKAIEAENRRATPEEQRILARYVGWGGLASAFPNPETGAWKDGWEDRGAVLKGLLTDKEYQLARRSTLDAHYTSQDVVQAMWSAARRLGFQGGMVLESSMGVGNFLGLVPEALAENTRFIGVEYDSLTARIAGLLYPRETVLHSGFQRVPLPDGQFDLNIGNPPFGEQSLRFQFKPGLNGASIHNQFIRAALDAVRPGGLQIQVVSRYLMDKQDRSDRLQIARKAKLLGAIRLPDTAFKENARTEVVTDILFFQKLDSGEAAAMEAAYQALIAKPEKDPKKERERRDAAALIPSWVEVAKVKDPLGGADMTVNRYFAENPQMVLGTLERSGSMKYENDVTVRLDKGADFAGMLAEAVATLPRDVLEQQPDAIARTAQAHQQLSDALRIYVSGQERGSIVRERDGKLYQVVERETPRGDFLLAKRELTVDTPWSPQLIQQVDGRWYMQVVATDEKGKPVKVQKDGKDTKRNVYEKKVFESEAAIPATMKLGPQRLRRLHDLVGLRDLYREQIVLETEDAPAEAMEGNRAKLVAAYEAYVAAHGLISEPATAPLLNDMPDGALVLSLEKNYRPKLTPARAADLGEEPREATAERSDILRRRVIPKWEPAGKAETAVDALQITLSERGRVDIERMAQLLGKTPAEVVADLHDNAEKPLIFKDPEAGTWETRNDYLTGPVKRKLIAARAAGLPRNVQELEAVQPEPIGAENITIIAGATWVPPQVYADFYKHMTGADATVSFSELTNTFDIRRLGEPLPAKQEQWGTDRMTVGQLVDALLNTRPIRVVDIDSDGNERVNQEHTQLAQLKAGLIATEFTDWVFANAERRAQLVEVYNEKFNTRVARQFDGSHLVLPGKVPDAIIRMRRHQKNAIWRGIAQRFNLYDHVVGAGKTYTMIARVMERRRMGLSRKPMIAVPNHMVEQFAADVYRLYPGAKVLAAGKADFERSRRRLLFARIASGDWDVVIVPHSSFGFIGIAPETEERFIEEELEKAKQAIKDAWEESGESPDPKGKSFRKPITVKEAERLRDKLEARLEKVRGNKNRDRLLTFEQLGVDDLSIDEAHEFKNLFYSSRLSGVRGMGDKAGSQKAYDLYTKVRVLRESPTGSVTFATGTPISNSAVEMFTMLRYLAAAELKELGLEHFDAFRAQFVSHDPAWEPTESGRLKEVNRLGRTWSNMRALMDLYYTVTDAVTNDDIKAAFREENPGFEFPIPKVKGGDRQSVVIQPTEAQVALLEGVLEGFDGLPYISDPQERNAERLRLMDRARKVSLDVRAVDPRIRSDEKGGKLERVADEVERLYKAWNDVKGTQLVFLDRSVPKAKGDDEKVKAYDAAIAARDAALEAQDEDAYRRAVERLDEFDRNEVEELRLAALSPWNAYQQIKDNLVARGIPANQIRFIQEANNDDQKQALFDAVNRGDVRILLGSTPRMGAGTNVQKRLVGLHHVDVTWKPSDIEQREGRIIRQGNLFATPPELMPDGVNPLYRPDFEVEVLAYATERTIDAKMWNLNSTKLRTINGIRKYDGAFVMEFEDEEAVSMAELAALASGDPMLLERVQLDSEIQKLELLERQHQRKMWGIESAIETAERDLKRLPGLIEANRAMADLLEERLAAVTERAKARTVEVEGETFTSILPAVQAAEAAVERQQGDNKNARYAVTVAGKRFTNKEGYLGAINEAFGDAEPFEAEFDGKAYTRRVDYQRDLAKKAAAEAVSLEENGTTQFKAGTVFGMTVWADVVRRDGSYGTHYHLELTASMGGKTVASSQTDRREDFEFTTQALAGAVRMLTPNPGSLRATVQWDEGRVRKASESLPDLRARVGEKFGKAEELATKRARLEEVIRLLSQAPAPASRRDKARDAAAELWDMANPTGWPNIPDVKFSLQADFSGFTLLPLPEVEDLGTPTREDMAAVEKLQNAVRARGMKDLTLTTLPPLKRPAPGASEPAQYRYAAVKMVEQVFGRRVIRFASNVAEFANGAHMGAVPDALFLNERLTRPIMAVLGHELTHAMRRDNPGLYDQLVARVEQLLRGEGAYAARLNAKRAAKGLPNLEVDAVREELIADIVGDNFTDPEFWKALASDNRSLFQRVLAAVRKWLDGVIARLRNERPYGTESYLRDVVAARAAVVEAMRAYAASAKAAEGAAALATEEAALTADDSPFFSALEREVDATPMNAAPAEGWKGWLKGLVAKGAIKADEVAWTGIEDWLDTQQGKVPRLAVQTYLANHGVRVTETVLGGRSVLNELDDLTVRADALGFTFDRETFEDGDYGRRTVMFTRRRDGVTFRWDYRGGFEVDDHPDNMDPGTIDPPQDPLIAIAESIGQLGEEANDGYDEDGTRYSQYTLPGGTNYREVLLTLPAPSEAALPMTFDEWLAAKGIDPIDDAVPELRSKYRREVGKQSDMVYQSNHWDQPNIVAHIRLDDRTDAEGKRVLFVEEIQSDWAQQGKREGFAGGAAPVVTAERVGPWFPAEPNGDGKFKVYVDGVDAGFIRAESVENAIQIKVGALGNASRKVPRAPFVDATDKWVGLALKRVMKMAVDGGYDRVAFITGEQSAERYDLSKQIDSIEYLQRGPDSFDVFPIAKGERATRAGMQQLGVSASKLQDIVGKEVAEKIVAGVGQVEREGGGKVLRGLDLKVGGEGMKAFYDKIVPATLKPMLKKFGGGPLIQVGVDVQGRPENATGLQEVREWQGPDLELKDVRWASMNDDLPAAVQAQLRDIAAAMAAGMPQARAIQERGSIAAARALGGDLVAKAEHVPGQPGFDVTPRMQELAAGGMPQFSLQGPDPVLEEAKRKAGFGGPRTLGGKVRVYFDRAVAAARSNWARQFQQGALDQFTGIAQAVRRDVGNLPIEQDPYVAARLANGGTSSVMRALLLHGQARWAANGQHLEKKPGTVGLLDILTPLGDEVENFFAWMVGQRAARLKAEGRENNLTDAEIDKLKGLGLDENGKVRPDFRRAALGYAAFKRSVLDVAEQAGLIDPEGRKAWDHADYIPFYRQVDEQGTFTGTQAPRLGRKGLSGQSSGIRMLRGGESALNDPLENILMNFSRLIDASLKNNALAKTVAVLEEAGSDAVAKVKYDAKPASIPRKQVLDMLVDAGTPVEVLDAIPEEAFEGMARMWSIVAPTDPAVIRIMVGGKPKFYRVNDPLLLKAATSFIPFDFPGLGVARAFKRILTAAVTATPEFMLRNFIRDSMAVQLIGRKGFSPHKSLEGIVKSYREAGGFEPMLFAGASFQSGQVNAGDPTDTARSMRRTLRRKGMPAFYNPVGLVRAGRRRFAGKVLDTPARWWEHYRQVGESIENANREAVYEATIKAGKGETAAAYEAKDLMDFTLRGSSPAYQLMADVLPFFNARVQGLYRLGRADPKRLVAYGMLMMAAAIALAWANSDNEEYDALPDWNKDGYWHFWIRGVHVKLPKPFELGVIFGTIPERIMRYAMGQDTGDKTLERVWANIRDQLAVDPAPQVIRPVLNVWANKDTFRDTPIETMGDENKLPSQRYSGNTSATARVAVGAIAPAADAIGLSPKKLEYLIGGYLGTMGLYALGLSDMAVRALENRPPRPALRLDEYPILRAFYEQAPARGTVYESDLYAMREEVARIYRSIKALEDDDTPESQAEADKLRAKHEKKLDVRKRLERATLRLRRLNKERDEVYSSTELTPRQKRAELDRILTEKAEVAREVMKDREVMEAR